MSSLIDVHTHIGCDASFYMRRWWPYAATARDLLFQMDHAQIGAAVCFPFGVPSAFDTYAFADRGELELLPDRVPFDRENQVLASEIERLDDNGRLLQLGMFDPGRHQQAQVRQLEKLLGKIVGLKTQSTLLQSPIRHLLGEGRVLMEFAQSNGLPVLIHTSILPADTWAQASDCLDVAAEFPHVRFNLAHSLRFHQPSLERAASMDNVWVDCSAHLAHCQLARDESPSVAAPAQRVKADYTQPVEVLNTIHHLLGGHGKYIWGSDNPFMSWCDDSIKAIYSYEQEAQVLHALPAPVRTAMADQGPRAWLGVR